MIGLALFVALASPQEPAPADESAKEALRKLSVRMKDARTLTAKIVQKRTSALLADPITSKGTLFYRRDPGKLVFRMSDPRETWIHLDKDAYQVYRPGEKRLERIEFQSDELAPRLFMVFEPKEAEIGKAFAIRRGESPPGEILVRLEPLDPKTRRAFSRLSLVLGQEDGALRRIAYTDPEGDDVQFDLSEVAINSELPPGTFELVVPEGTRILTYSLKSEK
jgi:outer membrane lipoprotein-sorting protein